MLNRNNYQYADVFADCDNYLNGIYKKSNMDNTEKYNQTNSSLIIAKDVKPDIDKYDYIARQCVRIVNDININKASEYIKMQLKNNGYAIVKQHHTDESNLCDIVILW